MNGNLCLNIDCFILQSLYIHKHFVFTPVQVHVCISERVGRLSIYTREKNISIKMLKDVGMTVQKSRETSAVYMQQDRG